MRAVIIDPWNQTVYVTDKPTWGLDEMYTSLSGPDGFRKCEDINAVRIGRDQMLWVDGEGLLIPEVPVWHLNGYQAPLAGIGLILGITEMGDNKGTYLEADWVQSMVRWTTTVTTGHLGPTTNPEPHITRLGDAILKEKGE